VATASPDNVSETGASTSGPSPLRAPVLRGIRASLRIEANCQRATLGGVHERFAWVRQRWLLILVLLIIVIGLAAALLGHDANNAYP
jgi:hypothetical protein